MDLGSTNGTFINVRICHYFSFSHLFKTYITKSKTLSLSLLIWCLVQDNRIEPQRYYELFEKDTIKFGNSRYNFGFARVY